MRFHKVVCWCLFLAATGPATRVWADPIQLISGRFTHDDERTVLLLETATFRVATAFKHSAFEVLPHEQCWERQCFPGMSFDPGVRTVDPPLNLPWDRSTFNGVVYPDLFIDGNLTVTGQPGIVPDLGTSFSTILDFPVTLTGFITIFPDSSRGTPLMSAELFGAGKVSILFLRQSNGSIAARMEDYQFSSTAPVPEPGTLLLAGSGALAVLRLRHRRRSQ